MIAGVERQIQPCKRWAKADFYKQVSPNGDSGTRASCKAKHPVISARKIRLRKMSKLRFEPFRMNLTGRARAQDKKPTCLCKSERNG
jgi:hypothetical protein